MGRKLIPYVRELQSLLDATPGQLSDLGLLARRAEVLRQGETDPVACGYLFAVEYVLDWIRGRCTMDPVAWMAMARRQGHFMAAVTHKLGKAEPPAS